MIDNIVYIAIVFFCASNQCGVMSVEKPYNNYDVCMSEVYIAEEKLKEDKRITIVEGRCASLKFGVKS
jgi:hypothetical protein